MSVKLGNFVKNKNLEVLKSSIAYETKMNTIKGIISNMDNLVELANDIYDTYYYIKKIDKDFAEKLWRLLCRNDNEININSYFSWGAKIGCYVYLSRYGVAIYNSSIKDDLMYYYECDEKELYRGKALLLDYLETRILNEKILDEILENLSTLCSNFESYANTIFNSVSEYKIQE